MMNNFRLTLCFLIGSFAFLFNHQAAAQCPLELISASATCDNGTTIIEVVLQETGEPFGSFDPEGPYELLTDNGTVSYPNIIATEFIDQWTVTVNIGATNADPANQISVVHPASNCNWFAEISIPECPVVLPVKLVSFEAENKNQTVELNWLTASESNNSHFEIQRSQNGQDFETIGRVQGAGDSTQEIQYSYIDVFPLNGSNYYRLRQVDFDGVFEFSDVEQVDFNGISLRIYPNPVIDQLHIRTNEEQFKVIVFNQNGIELFKESNQSTIDMNKFPVGIYYITIKGNKETHTRKIMKLN